MTNEDFIRLAHQKPPNKTAPALYSTTAKEEDAIAAAKAMLPFKQQDEV